MALTKLNNQSLTAVTSAGIPIRSGSVLQVVHKDADTNGTKVQNTSGTFATAFSASITPTLSTSKILVVINFSYMSNRDGDQLYTGHKLIRDIGGTTTTISSGKSASDDTSFMTSHLRYISHPAAAQLLGNGVFNILDTPNTTSAISYLLQHAQLGSNNWTQTGGTYFTLMEIAG